MILSNQILFIHSKNSFGKRNNKGIVQQKPMKALFVRIPASIQSTLRTTMIGITKRTQRNTLCPTERKPYAPYWFTCECLRLFCTLGVRDGESDGRAVRRAEARRFLCIYAQKYLQFLRFPTEFVQFRGPAAPSQTVSRYVVQMLMYTNFRQTRLKYLISGGHPPTPRGGSVRDVKFSHLLRYLSPMGEPDVR